MFDIRHRRELRRVARKSPRGKFDYDYTEVAYGSCTDVRECEL